MSLVLLAASFLVITSVASTYTDPGSADPQCPDNEQYVACELGYCQPKTCSDLGKDVPCPSIAEPCQGGCVCNDGYLRNATGTCVEEYICPTPECPDPENESFVFCAAGQCQAKHCRDIGQSIACPSFGRYCPGGCLCNRGYLRNEDGKCIKQETCPNPCPKPNTHFSACLPTCEVSACRQLRNPPPADCASYQLECHIGCACDDGYLWDESGQCVLREQCAAGTD